MPENRLTISGLYTYRDLVEGAANEWQKPGVYIWGFTTRGKRYPYYVGKHDRSVLERVKQHYGTLHARNRYTLLSNDILGDYGRRAIRLPLCPQPARELKPWAARAHQDFAYINDHQFILQELSHLPHSEDMGQLKNRTSQAVDRSSSHAEEFHIQRVIERYFGEGNFVCAFFVPSGKMGKECMRRLEAYVKYSLKYGTISQSNSSPVGSADFPEPLCCTEVGDPALREWFC